MDISFMPNLAPMASTSALVMVAGSRFSMPFQSALGAAETRFLSAVATATAAPAPRPAVSTALAALEPVAVPAAAPTARAPPTTTP